MAQWLVHYANACGQLNGWIERISEGIAEARYRAEQVSTAISLDVIVQVWPGQVIDCRGFVGYAPTGTMMQLTLDSGNANFSSCMGEPFERMVAHELHHVMRWRGPGYGRTLGEALVSEGLAGHFCRQLYASAPEPWESALSETETVACAMKAKQQWFAQSYRHDEWFFGQGGLPRWAGYSLGYVMVARYLQHNDGKSAASLVNEPAESFCPFL
ncbi:DUF2268 domain-containing putative Zn-dependent protease [Halomonas sp. HP20-15]|uniref:DUF2268 domain-containing putative Zn-dependent protease n=1 Tax=Halomonas sp. HP20-15 TaxID=3085901 RepID=UPI002980A9F2|nr:DUF2268 domain-containing putative Zn-dependent protease [Halomonas sp. HP20-15]MDW5375354.1 DUF2268 domain-containing putative Zn-dependent protease [Halomonas sp. HP20-15]